MVPLIKKINKVMVSEINNPNAIVTLSEKEAMELVIEPGVVTASVIMVLPFWQNNGIELLLTKEMQKNYEGNYGLTTKIPGGEIKIGENFIDAGIRETKEELVAQVSVSSIEFCCAWQAKNTKKFSSEKHYKICVIAHNFVLTQELAAKTVDTDIRDRFFRSFLDIVEGAENRDSNQVKIPRSQHYCLPFIANKLSAVSRDYWGYLADYISSHPISAYR